MTRLHLYGLQFLFGWMNLVLAVPSIYLMFGMPLVMRQYGWSGTQIGLFQLAALPAVCKFLFAIPVQRVRLGHGHFVNWLLLLSAVLLVFYWLLGRENLIGHRMPLFILSFTVSAFVIWADIPLNALAVQCLPRSEQLRAGSIRSAAMFLGAIIGGGMMIIVQSRQGWQMPFKLMGVGLLIGCLPFLLLRSKAELSETETARSGLMPSVVADWVGFFAQPGARQWTVLLLTSFPFIGAVWLYLKPLMLDQGIQLERVAFIIGIVGGVTGAVSSLAAGYLISFLGTARDRGIPPGCVMCAVSAVLNCLDGTRDILAYHKCHLCGYQHGGNFGIDVWIDHVFYPARAQCIRLWPADDSVYHCTLGCASCSGCIAGSLWI